MDATDATPIINENVMWNEYNNDPEILTIRSYYAADEGAEFFGDLSLASFASSRAGNPTGVWLGGVFGAASAFFTGMKHISASQLGVFNPSEAAIDFGAVGYGFKPLGSIVEEGANRGAETAMGLQSPNKFYTIPREEDTQAYRTYMDFMSTQNYNYNSNRSVK